MPDKIITENDWAAFTVFADSWYRGLKTVDVVPSDPTPGGTTWLSGVADGSDIIPKWAGFRGKPTSYARVWADSDRSNMDNLWALQDLTADGFSGVLDLAVGGPADWADAAKGGYDDEWTGQCRKALAYYGKLKELHLSMAHEFNGDWYGWSVSPPEQANFRSAWARWYGIVQRELVAKGKKVKVVLPFNSDTNAGFTIARGMPDPKFFDIVGCDFYSMWPPLPNQQAWDDNELVMKGDMPRGITQWINFAKLLGKPISFPEWGLNPNQPGNTVDNPFFIQKMFDTYQSIAPADPYNPGPGQLAGEAYFNNYVNNGRLYPTSPSAPNSKAVYRKLFGA